MHFLITCKGHNSDIRAAGPAKEQFFRFCGVLAG